LSRDLARLFPDLTGLLLAEHLEIAVTVCPEDLTLHRSRLLGQPSRMLRQLASALTDGAHRLVDLRADLRAGAAVQRRAHLPFDFDLGLVEAVPHTALDLHHGHLHDGLRIQELTRGSPGACRVPLGFLHRASRRSFDLAHRGVERGLPVPFVFG
jgi:hypothetical protein